MSSVDPGMTIGALLIGVLISYVLFGVTTTQAYIYYGRFPQDSLDLKLLVAFVWLCELAHAFCLGHTIYIMTISDDGWPERLDRLPVTLFVTVVFSCAISTAVQGFFALRIYRFSGRLYIPCLSWILTIVRSVCSLKIFVAGLRMVSFVDLEAHISGLLDAAWSINAVNDLLIAISLVYFLYRRRATAKNRNRRHHKFLKQPQNYAWLACFAISARLYANSVLANLNSRASLRTQDHTIAPFSSQDVIPQFNLSTTVEVELSKATRMTIQSTEEFEQAFIISERF
ncbi:hypothetical protein B0H11DRAFT_933581 [Mycena galericulata]|nr:hypothetical protein B0H11DRAFT_933581 [Mycena galericulata]